MTIDTKFVPLAFVLRTIKKWEASHKVLPTGDIVFQNNQFKINVRFTNESLNAIKKNPRGIEHIPNTIENPAEIWGAWENPTAQQVVAMNYIITDEKHIFVVQTKGGVITNSLINTVSNINKYRKGVLFIK